MATQESGEEDRASGRRGGCRSKVRVGRWKVLRRDRDWWGNAGRRWEWRRRGRRVAEFWRCLVGSERTEGSSQELVEQLILHDPYPVILQSLSHTGVSTAISVGNEHLHEASNNVNLAKNWKPSSATGWRRFSAAIFFLLTPKSPPSGFNWPPCNPSGVCAALNLPFLGCGVWLSPVCLQRSCRRQWTMPVVRVGLIVSYWKKNKRVGGTCSFGGTAMLINAEPTDEKPTEDTSDRHVLVLDPILGSEKQVITPTGKLVVILSYRTFAIAWGL
ncbi:hypothetical protein Acr_02g0013110 [Actinidia rufa]|uniref:Uncharacterized protein n=1 Tax=Actinidia rufa TaxID=165716 RepID=A0A7J0E993_9ERIC|nr:hypothetical protein Acr_02g0013110 [Actinidia rufa]